MFLFQAINDGIKSGILNFNHSYRFRFLEEYLISKREWKDNKEQLLTDSEMTHLIKYEDIIGVLKENLDQLYHQVNDGYILGLNPHLRFDKINKPIVETPAVEKTNLSKISSYFTPARFISILDLLADVEKTAPFLHHLGHQSKTHERKRPTPETFFASIIALGWSPDTNWSVRNKKSGRHFNQLLYTHKSIIYFVLYVYNHRVVIIKL